MRQNAMNVHSPRPSVSVRSPPALFTTQDYETAIERLGSDVIHELDEGTLVAMPPPYVDHARVVNAIAFQIRLILRDAGSPLEVLSELGFVIGPATIRVPDVAVFDPAFDSRKLAPVSAARLFVEVAQTSLAEDLGPKATAYAIAGVPDYWVADLSARIAHVMRDPGGGVYRVRDRVPFGEPLTAACLPAPVVIPA